MDNESKGMMAIGKSVEINTLIAPGSSLLWHNILWLLCKKNMKKSIAGAPDNKKETTASLKNESHKKDSVKKGYNEKNPTQPQGAFVPDSINNKTKKS